MLNEPLRFFVSLPNTMIAGISELTNEGDLASNGHGYVLGRYKKFLFTFKRAAPVEISLTLKIR